MLVSRSEIVEVFFLFHVPAGHPNCADRPSTLAISCTLLLAKVAVSCKDERAVGAATGEYAARSREAAREEDEPGGEEDRRRRDEKTTAVIVFIATSTCSNLPFLLHQLLL